MRRNFSCGFSADLFLIPPWGEKLNSDCNENKSLNLYSATMPAWKLATDLSPPLNVSSIPEARSLGILTPPFMPTLHFCP